ncbi:unnamed protein product [Pleuronectes platessa]|uniref:Uncharacterized protein n=1 Tax=Pleuronectes platessa TaxID=8262 RepID=A0A9N7YG54_PLEPL|nr:unnamed protein product [Pleuronectes platessa]
MFTPMGRVGGQVSQVNNLAGEEAVDRAMVLAYVPCFRDTSEYAKPEVYIEKEKSHLGKRASERKGKIPKDDWDSQRPA